MTVSMDSQLAALREQLPALDYEVYLNAGTAGPLARRTVAAITRASERQLIEGRSNFKTYMEDYFALIIDLRARFARLLGAGTDEIALTHHTSEGMNIAIWGINWRPGDEIIATTHEHEGGLLPTYAVTRRFGLGLRMVDISDPATMAESVIAAITPRTRLVVLSHVTFTTGAILPLAAIAAAAHRQGALLAVDGAQSGGTMPLQMRDLDVDFYAVTGQKWLCGPEGIGALYVRRERQTELTATFMGFFGISHPDGMDLSGYFMPAAGAGRYEGGTVYWPALYGMQESLRWMEEDLGWPWIYERTATMTQRCRAMLSALPGVTIHSPTTQGALTAFSVAGHDAMATATWLADHGIRLRSVPHYNWLRVATGFFTSDEDLDRLREALLALPAETPANT